MVYPPVGFLFRLSFVSATSSEEALFKEVGEISMEIEVEDIKVGGTASNLSVPKEVKYSDLVLKRGLVTMGSNLEKWCFTTNNYNLEPIQRNLIVLELLNEEGDSRMEWYFYNAYPFKWQLSGFDAQSSAILIESISFKYSKFDAIRK